MKLKATIVFLLTAIPLLSLAAGLGDIHVKSSLNEPFDATIPTTDIGNVPFSAVSAKLASENKFESVGLKKELVLSTLQFNIKQNKQQQFYIEITSSQPIEKPTFTFLLQLNWPNGEVIREYTVFLDPVGYNSAPTQTTNISAPASAQQAAMAPSQGKMYGPTTMQDNSWVIGEQLSRSNHASINQNMISLLKLNPDAFLQNNINGLKAGYMLQLPSGSQANAVNETNAKQLIAAQNAAWQIRTQTTVLPTPPSNQNTVEQTQNQPPSSLAPDVLQPTLASNTTPQNQTIENANESETPIANNALANQQALNPNSSNPNIESLENEVAISSAAMQAAMRANQSLQTDVADLHAQIDALKQEIDEKNRALAALQKINTQPTPAAPAPINNNAPTPSSSSSWLFLLTPLLLLLAIGFFYANKKISRENFLNHWAEIKAKLNALLTKVPRKSESKPSTPQNIPSTPAIPNLILSKTATPIPDPHTLVVNDDPSSSAAVLDIVDEADVYIAYGRYEKAETLLKNSLTSNAQQPELRLKLLEIYLAQKDKHAFDQELELLGDLTNLPLMFQTKLTKLLESWKHVDMSEDSSSTESLLETSAPSLSAAESTKKPTEPAFRDTSSRIMEFEGDLSHLYSQSTLEKVPEKESIPNENDLLISPNQPLELIPTPELTPDIPPAVSDATIMLQTELDLAKSYLDMGDSQEALSILQPILQTGNEEQKRMAQELIEKIEQPTQPANIQKDEGQP